MYIKKIFNLLSLKHLSFTSKIILSFFIFVIIFSILRAVLTLPKIQEKNTKEVMEHISTTLQLTKVQFKLVSEALSMQTKLEIELNKQKIENEIKSLQKEFNFLSKNSIYKLLNKNTQITNSCSFMVKNLDFNYKTLSKNNYFFYNKKSFINKWIELSLNKDDKAFRKKRFYIYNHKIENKNMLLSLACSKQDLNINHGSFEKKLKNYINTKLLDDSGLSSAQIALFWVNPNFSKEKPLFTNSLKQRKKRYTLSNLSNVKNLPASDLTLKQLLDSKEKIPIKHKVENKEVMTWVIRLNSNPSQNRYFLLLYSVNKKDIENKNNAGITFLFTETLIAVGISFFIILFFIRRVLKNIDKVTKTAILVNEGKKNIRCNVKGNDDIGILGQAFDAMLDFFENSIKTLDEKVKQKTKKISDSLEEKNILLKEIHHRVKNNLALTIGLIELQQEEVKDEKTKKVLIDIQERVFTMELLHRKLYESSNIDKIFLDEYIYDLVQIISNSYDINKKVESILKIEKIELNITKAMPCGLIINELVTNSYKYAFKTLKQPKLEVNIYRKNSELVIIIKDNGKGLKKDFYDIYNDTLGLKLVSSIVKYQLFGTIDYKYENGAKFIIKTKI